MHMQPMHVYARVRKLFINVEVVVYIHVFPNGFTIR